MDKEFIRQMLPEKPRPGLLNWTKSNHDGELGEEYLVWSSEQVQVYEMDEVMDGRQAHRKVRYARCYCHACGSTFYTEQNGGLLSFWMDDCGGAWPLDPFGSLDFENDDENWDNGYDFEVGDTDHLPCPMCESDVTVIKSRRLEPSRLKQILVASVEVVDNYVAILYWLVSREIRPEGSSYGVAPRDAYVLNEKGRLVHYTHTAGGGFTAERYSGVWRLASSNKDCWEKQYHDWGSINSWKVGGFYWPDVPDLEGTTGEKTGLYAYASSGGEYWVAYLRLQRQFPQVENLVNAGWTKLIGKLVAQCYMGYDAESTLSKCLDISKRKPHEMLGMSKSDHKLIRERNAQWDFDTQFLYRQFVDAGLGTAVQFLEKLDSFGSSGFRAVAEMQRLYGDADLEKVERYLSKQNISPSQARLLLDTRNAANALAGGRPLTAEELWPRNLAAAHDRYTRLRVTQIDAEKAAKYQAGFDKILDEYGDLQWTDGNLCMVLPKCNGDLIREGDTLRHCVGGYGSNHISGRDVIFFVRHYRRPERSYYTLDINMLDRPYRNQLHGYGNERHGINKQYSHKIPQKVLDFCARWEKEVLMPWYWNKQKQAQLEQKGSKTA